MEFDHKPNGEMAINAMVPDQLAFRPDGTLGGATKPDLATASPNTLATVENVREMNRMPVFFQGIHNGTRAGLQRLYKGCATPNDAIQISALTHPELVKGVLRGDVATCDETAYQNDPYQRGKWSRGTAYLDGQGKPQGWVRTPDLNQAMADSLPPPFARGGADVKAGSIGKDTMRELTGNITRVFNANNAANADGVFEKSAGSGVNVGGASSSNASNFNFAASRGLPEGHTGDEFAPWHIYGVSYSITSNGVFNEGAIDAEQVMGDVLLDRARLIALEESIYLYPNNGSEAAPATLGANQRYELPNPYPGWKIDCRAEIFINGKWGDPLFGDHQSGSTRVISGVSARPLGDDLVSVQTGVNGVKYYSNYQGDPFGVNDMIVSAPGRVLVWRVSKIGGDE